LTHVGDADVGLQFHHHVMLLVELKERVLHSQLYTIQIFCQVTFPLTYRNQIQLLFCNTFRH
jgi:hypothetical protein